MQKVSCVCTLLSSFMRYSAPVIGQTSRQSVHPCGHFVWLMVIFPEMNLRTCMALVGSFVSQIVQQGQCSLSMLTMVLNQLRSGSVSTLGFSTGFPSEVV